MLLDSIVTSPTETLVRPIRASLACSQAGENFKCKQLVDRHGKKTQILAPTSRTHFVAGLHNLQHPCIHGARKWRENETMKRKWRENQEMERDSLFTFPHFLFFSSLSIHFLYQKLSHFVAKSEIRL